MATLEIIIGIVFIFLLLSLLGTILQEFYSTASSLRGRLLLDGLARLLEIKYKEDNQDNYRKHFDQKKHRQGSHRFRISGFLASFFTPARKQATNATGYGDAKEANPETASEAYVDFKSLILKSKIYQNLKSRYFFNLIESLPSYLSAEQVMAIYEEALTQEKYPTGTGKEINIKTCIKRKGDETSCKNWSSDIKIICQAALEEGKGAKEITARQLIAARSKMAVDFEQLMDRLSGQFKRQLQVSLFFIGLLIAVAFNADTLRIYRSLSSNPEGLKAVLDMADSFVSESRIEAYIVSPSGNSIAINPEDTAIVRELQDMRHQASTLLQYELQSVRSPLGLGWDRPPRQATGTGQASSLLWIARKIPGWLITALAISLGAPFWFDLLSRLVNIRNAGKRPQGQSPTVIPPAFLPEEEQPGQPTAP